MSSAAIYLTKTENLTIFLSRVMSNQIELSKSFCSQAFTNPDMACHEIRKSFKRIRAILRLYRQTIGEEIYLRENQFYRDTGLLLAPFRVSAMHIETLAMLSAEKKAQPFKNVYRKLSTEIIKNHKKLTTEIVTREKIFIRVQNMLNDGNDRLAAIPDFKCDFNSLTAGVRKTYSDGQKKMYIAMQQPAMENFHNLRKEVKYLWNQLQLLRPLWPALMGQMIRNLDQLGERLGLEHDLAELENHLVNTTDLKNLAADSILKHIVLKRAFYQKSIWIPARRIFAENPAAFSKRLNSYWNILR